MTSVPLPRSTTQLTRHHRYRIEHGIYPETMRPVVAELCDEVERLAEMYAELDTTFYNWRQKRYAMEQSA